MATFNIDFIINGTITVEAESADDARRHVGNAVQLADLFDGAWCDRGAARTRGWSYGTTTASVERTGAL